MCSILVTVAVTYVVVDLVLSAVVIARRGGIRATLSEIQDRW